MEINKLKIIRINKVGIDELGLIVEYDNIKYMGCISELQFKEMKGGVIK